QIKGSLRGGIYYIDKKMAVYRRYAAGSWTMRVLKNGERLAGVWEVEKKLLNTLDIETGGMYHEAICERMKAYTTFLSQLNKNAEMICGRLEKLNGNLFMWGMGRRGVDFELFCYEHDIPLSGVCDITNDHVGEKTECGNMIVHTDDALKRADYILATNDHAYGDLIKIYLPERVIGLQEYMPFG
ncbi:MAG: hypothetical protein K6F34_09650, partial [Lachnospiraceae bacterium]|nr:hypothetical protein [Lachnospiraceae bacterium]